MATATTVKVSRTKLIERLQERVSEQEKSAAENFKKELADHIDSAKEAVLSAQEYLDKLKTVKTPEDINDTYWSRGYRNPNENLKRAISALEMSDEETILLKPDSDLYRWL